jgi:hypothetical protein
MDSDNIGSLDRLLRCPFDEYLVLDTAILWSPILASHLLLYF